MKSKMKILIVMFLATFVTSVSFARRGQNDGGNSPDDGRAITCIDKVSNQVVLNFLSTAGVGQVTTDLYELTVKVRGDDISEMLLVDMRFGSSLKAKRLEELLKVTLLSSESIEPVIAETSTHRGYGESILDHLSNSITGFVKSLSRRGESRMEISFGPSQSEKGSLHFLCQKIR